MNGNLFLGSNFVISFLINQKNNANFQLAKKIMLFSTPQKTPKFEQPRKITNCEISNPKKDMSIPVQISYQYKLNQLS